MASSATSKHRFKVVLLGEGRVGKTSILLRFVKNSYDDRQRSTLAASYLDKHITLGSKSVKLSIWDTAGQERFHALGPLYYRDANGALLVYDITDAESFKRVEAWVTELREQVKEGISIIIAGNKCDLEKNRNVNKAEAEAYAKSVGAKHIETSAKLGKNLDRVFLELTKQMLANSPTTSKPGKKAGLVIVDEPSPSSGKKGGCC